MPTKVFKTNPMPKPRMTRADRWKKRPIVVKYWAYKDSIREEQGDFRFPHGGAEVTFYMEMPKSWSKKKKVENLGKPHQKKKNSDLDNLLKALWDALVWDEEDDDGMIWSCKANKFWSDDPRIEVSYPTP